MFLFELIRSKLKKMEIKRREAEWKENTMEHKHNNINKDN